MIKNFTLILIAVLGLVSCSTQRSIGNGAYSDISLNRDSNEYTLKRLDEVSAESRAIFGIPIDGKVAKKEGIVVRFNGINLSAQNKFIPTLSMVALTFVTGSALHGVIGDEIEEEALSYTISGVAAIPIAGAINNQIWSDAALSRASWNANSQLLQENPEIDVFLNPKYEIKTNNGLWSQRASLEAKVIGARIKTDN